MKKPVFSLIGLLIAFSSCTPTPREVVERRFPQCFEKPMIGASSGAMCEYDEAEGQWRITFWRGWGDCPAGCIHKEVTARYVVDGRGRVFEADKDFNPVREVDRGEAIRSGKPVKDAPVKSEPGAFIKEPGQGAKDDKPDARMDAGGPAVK
jgi:hypothetical protein